jgi:hypothetical protein
MLNQQREGPKANYNPRQVSHDVYIVQQPHILQIEGPTQTNIYGFKTTPIGQSNATRERTEMSIMSLEIFGKLL